MPEPRAIAVLADCHIHPGHGITWPLAVLERLAGVDLIVTLGDMGESAGLEALANVAPLVGVRGQDDGEDERTGLRARVVELGGLAVGCVFDAVAAGLASAREPFAAATDYEAAEARLFGRRIDVLLHAGTHRPTVETFAGRLAVNPGSATLPDDHAPAAFARLTVGETGPDAEIIAL